MNLPTGSYFVVTGTTGISAINNRFNGFKCTLKFSDALTLTHGAGFVLPGAANITTAAGDVMEVVNESSGVWRCTGYERASGVPVAGASGAITSSSFTMATAKVLGRDTASTGAIEELSLSEVLDLVGSAAQGDILYRDAAGWARLAAGTDGYFLKTQGAAANPAWAEVPVGTLGTPTNASSTSTDLAVSAGAKRITVSISGLSTNGASAKLIQLGDSGGVETSNYSSVSARLDYSSVSTAAFTAGFGINSVGAAEVIRGAVTLTLMNASTNTWVIEGTLVNGGTQVYTVSGEKSLSGELTTIRFTTVTGADIFDAGALNTYIE